MKASQYMYATIRVAMTIAATVWCISGNCEVGFNQGSSSKKLEVPHLRKEKKPSPSIYYYSAPKKKRYNGENQSTKKHIVMVNESDVWDNDVSAVNAAGMAMKGAMKTEFGEGCGETREEAIKEALRDVLQKVVGVYVDSDFRMKNDEIINDEVITHSSGLIDGYDIVKDEIDVNGRGVKITIKAQVVMREFVDRMKKIEAEQKFKVDGLLLDTNIRNSLNAESLVQKELENLNVVTDLLEVKICNTRPKLVATYGDSVTLRYAYQVMFSKEKYCKKFVPRIVQVLDQVAQEKYGKTFIPAQVVSCKVNPAHFCFENEGLWRGEEVNVHLIRMSEMAEKYMGFAQRRWHYDFDSSKQYDIVESWNKQGVTIRSYKVAGHVAKILHDAQRSIPNKMVCRLNLLDQSGTIVGAGYDDIGIAGCFDTGYSIGICISFPFIAHQYDYYYARDISWKYHGVKTFTDRIIGYIDVDISKDDLAQLSSAEIKLEATNRTN